MCVPGGPKFLLDIEPRAPRTPNCPAPSQTTPEGAPVRLAPGQPAQGPSPCKEQSPSRLAG